MPSIITLDGARSATARLFRGLAADEWSADAPAEESLLGKATASFLGWGFVAFGVGTAALRAWDATVGRRGSGDVKGAGRRRRRGR